MFREGLKQILGREPDVHSVDEAGNGSEAMDRIRARHYTVVVLDISMPGQTGWDILSSIRHEKPGLPVLILSMHPEEQYAVRMLKAGAAGYVTKESAADVLIGAIRKVAAGGLYVSSVLAEKLASTLSPDSTVPLHQQLSNREFQVMSMLASGVTLREIADALCLSEKTITTYRARVLEKLGVRNNVELTRYAMEHKLLG